MWWTHSDWGMGSVYLRRFKTGKTARDIDLVIRAVVRSAARNILAYGELLRRQGASPSSIREVSDLSKLPIVTKEWLFRDAAATDRLHKRARLSRLAHTNTAGYTGLPVEIYMSQSEMLFRRILLLREWRRLAPLPLRLRVADAGSWVGTDEGHLIVRYGPITVLRISNGLPPADQVGVISRFRPHALSGYPTTVALLAEHWTASPPRLITTRGEILHEDERALIEQGFGVRPIDLYNTEEIGNVATECPADTGNLHVNTDACIVEVVDDASRPLPDGEEGRIAATSLYNCTMPLIRYAVGDRGATVASDRTLCACGSRRPKMRVVEGRDDDYVIMSDGRRLSPRVVGTTVKRTGDKVAAAAGRTRLFRRMQVVQDRPDHVAVRLVPDGDLPIGYAAAVADALREVHPQLESSVELVESIEFEPSGKLKKIIRQIEGPET